MALQTNNHPSTADAFKIVEDVLSSILSVLNYSGCARPHGLSARAVPYRRFQDALRSVRGPFRSLQDASKRPPDASKNPPRAPETPSRHPQELSKSSPRALQGASKGALRGLQEPKRLQEPPMKVQESPRVPQEPSRSTPRSLQERAKRPLKPNPKMPQRPQELRCCKERFVSKVQGSSAWVGGTRERGYNKAE